MKKFCSLEGIQRSLLLAIALSGVAFAILSLAASVALMFPFCTGKFAYGYIMDVSFYGIFSYGFAIIAIWIALEYGYRKWPNIFVKFEIAILMSISILTTLCFARLLPALVHIDGEMAWDSLMVYKSVTANKICFFHPIRNTYWCNYEILNSVLGIVFNNSIFTCRVFQGVLCAAAVFPVFRLSECIAGRKIARFVALMIIMSPTLNMYSMLPTSEFLSASLLSYFAYFFMKGLNRQYLSLADLICFLFAGIFWGISDLFKPISPVLIVAMFITGFLYFCFTGRKCALKLLMAFMIILPSLWATHRTGQTILAGLAQTPQLMAKKESFASSLLYELALGLDVDHEGFWNKKLALDFLKMSEENQRKFVKNAMFRDWEKYPMLMVRKFRNMHGSDCYHHGAVRQFISLFRDSKGRYRPPRGIISLADTGTIFFKIIFILGVGGLMLSRRRTISFLAPGIFALLVVLEFSVLEQLIEGHGRYKTAIYPFYFMLLPYMCVWFEKDNPIYVRLMKWVRGLVSRL